LPAVPGSAQLAYGFPCDPLVIRDIPVWPLNASIHKTQHRQQRLLQPIGSYSDPWSGSRSEESDSNDGLRWRIMRSSA
jgi:hypothetical protein